jgi:hypothetical protein
MPEGFYPLESIFMLLALMALARIPSLEALRYVAPGEWGKLIGLDRIPEVRTLRQKVSELCSERGRAEALEWDVSQAMDGERSPECRSLLRRRSRARLSWQADRFAPSLYCS